MAIAFDAVTEMTAGTGTLSVSHNPVGTPKAAKIYIVEDAVTATQVSAVTYGGVALVQEAESPRVSNSTEDGIVSSWLLTSGIPTGAQTAQVTVSGSATKWAAVLTATGATAATQSVGQIGFDETATGNDSLVTVPNASGISALYSIVAWHAVNAEANITPSAGWTERAEHDFGNAVCGLYTLDAITTGSQGCTFGFSANTNGSFHGSATAELADPTGVARAVKRMMGM